MELFGKQRHFLFGLGAREKILDLCENRNLANLNKLISDDNNDTAWQTYIKIGKLMQANYEDRLHFMNKQYQQDYVTDEEISFMDVDEQVKWIEECLQAITIGTKREVEGEAIKAKAGKGKKA